VQRTLSFQKKRWLELRKSAGAIHYSWSILPFHVIWIRESLNLKTFFLYDIDDLEGIVESNLQERQKAAAKIRLMIEKEIVDFNHWLGMLGVIPVISALREKALAIQSETMVSLERKLPNLSDRDIKVLNKHTKSIINQLLKDPILQAKELAARPDAEQAMELFMKIFNIEELVQEQHSKAAETNKIPVREVQASFQS